jgi:hypothetical protein
MRVVQGEGGHRDAVAAWQAYWRLRLRQQARYERRVPGLTANFRNRFEYGKLLKLKGMPGTHGSN